MAFGNYYQDEGITASYLDDDLSNQVTIKTDINLSTIGTYEIKYTLKRGLALRVKKRVIKVVDKEKPVITLKGDLEYPLCGREYVEQGYQAGDNVDGDITKNDKIKNIIENMKATFIPDAAKMCKRPVVTKVSFIY